MSFGKDEEPDTQPSDPTTDLCRQGYHEWIEDEDDPRFVVCIFCDKERFADAPKGV